MNTGGTTTIGRRGRRIDGSDQRDDRRGRDDRVQGGSIRTTGAQTYNDAVTLNAATMLTSTGFGTIDLASTVNGTFRPDQ